MDNHQCPGKIFPIAQIVTIYELLRTIRSNWAWEGMCVKTNKYAKAFSQKPTKTKKTRKQTTFFSVVFPVFFCFGKTRSVF